VLAFADIHQPETQTTLEPFSVVTVGNVTAKIYKRIRDKGKPVELTAGRNPRMGENED
jgi:hypothetical protein